MNLCHLNDFLFCTSTRRGITEAECLFHTFNNYKFLYREETFDAHIHVSQNTHDYVREYKKYFRKDVCIKTLW